MTKEQIAAIAVVLLFGAVFFCAAVPSAAGTAERAAKAETAAENRQNALSDVRCGSKSHGQTVGVSVVRRLRLDQIKFGYKNNPVKCG